ISRQRSKARCRRAPKHCARHVSGSAAQAAPAAGSRVRSWATISSFHLAMLGHARAVLIDLHVAPFIIRVLSGDGTARPEGGGTRRADLDPSMRPDPGAIKPVGMVRLGDSR